MTFKPPTPEQWARQAVRRREAALRWERSRVRKPVKPVSDKRRVENRERRAMAERRWPDGRPRCAVPGCWRLADDLHEVLSRARGGSITDEANTEPLCRTHHTEITDTEPAWAYALGLLRHSWDVA